MLVARQETQRPNQPSFFDLLRSSLKRFELPVTRLRELGMHVEGTISKTLEMYHGASIFKKTLIDAGIGLAVASLAEGVGKAHARAKIDQQEITDEVNGTIQRFDESPFANNLNSMPESIAHFIREIHRSDASTEFAQTLTALDTKLQISPAEVAIVAKAAIHERQRQQIGRMAQTLAWIPHANGYFANTDHMVDFVTSGGHEQLVGLLALETIHQEDMGRITLSMARGIGEGWKRSKGAVFAEVTEETQARLKAGLGFQESSRADELASEVALERILRVLAKKGVISPKDKQRRGNWEWYSNQVQAVKDALVVFSAENGLMITDGQIKQDAAVMMFLTAFESDTARRYNRATANQQ